MRALVERLRRRLHSPAARLVYHPSYAGTVAGVPIDPARADAILAFLLDHHLSAPREIVRPVPASLEDLLRVHSSAYLDSVQQPAAMTAIFGAPLSGDGVAAVLARQRVIVGGTIAAARVALATGRVGVNLQGGLHHAAPERGAGFCVFNDVAVAIAVVRAHGFTRPVLVVDLDLHDGNGTREAFARDPSVYTFSIHNRAWTEEPAAASTSIALGSDVGDETYLAALRDALPPVVRAHRPGLAFYIAGCDPAADDVLGDWRITPQGMLARDQFVTDLLRGGGWRGGAPLVIVPGGGYGNRAWRYSARFLAWLVSGRPLDPPSNMETVLARFRRVGLRHRALGSLEEQSARSADAEAWALSEEDVAPLIPGGGGAPRVLGYYSPYALELLMERLGFFQHLRERGFRAPELAVQCGHEQGDTIRVWGEPGRAELLVELRVNRNTRLVPGLELLYVEWLLLQNPRTRFTGRLAPLPGQAHPGLGLLGEIAVVLLVMCEVLGLDGVAFVPAHYYAAALGRHELRFLEPRPQARFEALAAAVAGMSLAEAERAIAAGHVVDRTGAPVHWEPSPMVIPVSERLRALVSGAGYEEALGRERASLRGRWRLERGAVPGALDARA